MCYNITTFIGDLINMKNRINKEDLEQEIRDLEKEVYKIIGEVDYE